MDTASKLAIAIKLLENGISMLDIRSWPAHQLEMVAQRLAVDPHGLAAFAEEVGGRTEYLAQFQSAERQRLTQTTVLITDDESIYTLAMNNQRMVPTFLSDQQQFLQSGVTVLWRIRNSELAQRCSQELQQPIEATTEALPKLKANDIVLDFPAKQRSERGLMVNWQLYRPDPPRRNSPTANTADEKRPAQPSKWSGISTFLAIVVLVGVGLYIKALPFESIRKRADQAGYERAKTEMQQPANRPANKSPADIEKKLDQKADQ